MQQPSNQKISIEKAVRGKLKTVYCRNCGARLFDTSEFSKYYIEVKCRKCNKILPYEK